MTAPDAISVALRVATALEQCGVRYLVGGSLASSLSGEPRSTLDVDMVVALSEAQVEPFVDALGPDFYADPEALRRAIRDRSSANLLHYATAMKVDLFIAGNTPIDDEQLDRRQRICIGSDPERHLYFYTSEDILLQKLRWYRLTDEASDRQWRDVMGIVSNQQGALDLTYLRRNAARLGIGDLLERALAG